MDKRGINLYWKIGIIVLVILIFTTLIDYLFLRDFCVGEGKLSLGKDRKGCCSGLDSFPTNIEDISIGDECYSNLNLADLSMNALCVDCGDGKCSKLENKCSCPADCNKEESDFNSIEEFCKPESFDDYCVYSSRKYSEPCTLCSN